MIRSQFFLVLLFLCSFAMQLAAAEARQKPAYFYVTTLADGATFMMRLEDPKLIQEARDILSGKETREVHVSGTVVKAPAAYNNVWSFHLDPDSVDFFSLAAEVCDAATVMVEKDLESIAALDCEPAGATPLLEALERSLKPTVRKASATESRSANARRRAGKRRGTLGC